MSLSPESGSVDAPANKLTSVLAPRGALLSDDALAAIAQASPLSDAQVRRVAASFRSQPRFSVITDTATTDDRLGFQPLVQTLAGIVLSNSTETPLAIAMDGKWGSGKTSILKMVESQARLVGFNSIWLNAWALERAEHLIAELTAGIQDELVRSGRTPGASFTDKLGVFLGRAFASLVPDRLGGQAVRGLLQANVKMAETQADAAEIASIVRTHRAFQDLVNILLERGSASPGQNRLLVLIDDLDRALPDQVTSMLKNLKQLVEMEGCVFLLAMDVELVAKGIEDFYRARYTAGSNISLQSTDGATRLDVTPEHGSITPGFGRNYLEKLVQIILPVPQLSRAVVLDCVRSFGFAEEVVEIVAWAPDAEILNPRRLKHYLNTLSVTLQLVTASSLPKEFDNAYALRALALRRDWRKIYDTLLTLPPTGITALDWPEAESKDNETQEKFREYVARLRAETGALARFEAFLVTSNLFSASDTQVAASGAHSESQTEVNNKGGVARGVQSDDKGMPNVLENRSPHGADRNGAHVFVTEWLGKTMSNPRYHTDIVKLDENGYLKEAVIDKQTVIIVVGNTVPAELLDRPVAEYLRDRIDDRANGNPFRRAVVLTDTAWYGEDLAASPVIAIGGPPANKLSREFDGWVAESSGEGKYSIPGTEPIHGFFRKNAADLPQVGLWGQTANGTREAVEHYLRSEEGLAAFLKMAWK